MDHLFRIGALTGGSALLLLSLSACDWMPGKPKESDVWRPPTEERDFASLYEINCLGCHSNGKTIGASLSMNNPLYLSIIPRETLRQIIASGIPGTLMPKFNPENRRDFSKEQIDVLVDGIYRWGPGKVDAGLPPYSASGGDPSQGALAYNNFCEKCHGPDGKGGPAGSIVDLDYLHLVSGQYLRSVIIAGRPELGMPDFQHDVPAKAMSPEEITNVVAWLANQRNPGMPNDQQQASAENQQDH